MLVDGRRLQIGMPERRRDKSDRGAVVERMTGVGMPKRVRRDLPLDARSPGGGFYDVGHPPLADREHSCTRTLPLTQSHQIAADRGREEDIAGLVALAKDRELHLAAVPGITSDQVSPSS